MTLEDRWNQKDLKRLIYWSGPHESSMDNKEMLRLLSLLTEKEETVLWLIFCEKMTPTKVGERFDLKATQVKKVYCSAFWRLRMGPEQTTPLPDVPRCRQCGKQLRPFRALDPAKIEKKRQDDPHFREEWIGARKNRSDYSSVIGLGYNGEGLFCSLQCGYEYGVKAAKEGLPDA